MYDMLPFPNITAATPEEQVAQINNYLIQFKETLEFILTNISTDNLSQDLVNKLNTLGADIEKSIEDRDYQLQQVSNKSLTVSDVINSNAFEIALENATPKEYLVSAEQIQTSDEPDGANIYAIKDESGEVQSITIKNGKNGADGKDGTNGKDGVTPAFKIEEGELKVSYDGGNTWTSLGVICSDGSYGTGTIGLDDAVGISKAEINSAGELVMTFSDNTVSNLGVVVGAKGDKGEKGDKGDQGLQGLQGIQGIQGVKGDKGDTGAAGKDGANGINGTDGVDGVGIESVKIDNGDLRITLTSGTTLNLGNIKGQDGKNGVDGKTPNVSFSVNLGTGNLEYTIS